MNGPDRDGDRTGRFDVQTQFPRPEGHAKPLGGTTTVYLYDQAGKLIAEASPVGATLTEYVHLGYLPVALFR